MNRHRCECSICTERGAEIDRLQEAKRAALKLADERAQEANVLRQALQFARKRIWYYGTISDRRHFDHDLAEVYPTIDAALSLTDEVREPRTGAGSLD